MTRYFLDTSVLLLAVGAEHPGRRKCREFLRAITAEGHSAHASVEAGQEFLFHRVRRVGGPQAMREFAAVEQMLIWHPFDLDVLRAARDLMASAQARGRDAVHAATARLAGFDAIVTCDADFDGIPGLRRLDPAEALDG